MIGELTAVRVFVSVLGYLHGYFFLVLTVFLAHPLTELACKMEIIGLDLHKRESQLAIKADDGTITDRRIATSRERFTAVLGARPRARILLEASTESEWVARHLETLGQKSFSRVISPIFAWSAVTSTGVSAGLPSAAKTSTASASSCSRHWPI